MREQYIGKRTSRLLEFRDDNQLPEDKVQGLFESVQWMSAKYASRLVKAFNNSPTVISAWEGERLIGLVQGIDDGELTAYIHYLLVNPEYQKEGVGERLIHYVKEKYRDYLYLIVICEHKDTIPFYEKQGLMVSGESTPIHIIVDRK